MKSLKVKELTPEQREVLQAQINAIAEHNASLKKVVQVVPAKFEGHAREMALYPKWILTSDPGLGARKFMVQFAAAMGGKKQLAAVPPVMQGEWRKLGYSGELVSPVRVSRNEFAGGIGYTSYLSEFPWDSDKTFKALWGMLESPLGQERWMIRFMKPEGRLFDTLRTLGFRHIHMGVEHAA